MLTAGQCYFHNNIIVLISCDNAHSVCLCVPQLFEWMPFPRPRPSSKYIFLLVD